MRVLVIQVGCATGFLSAGCVTLHPLRAAALIHGSSATQRIEISNQHGTTAAALTLR